jgi:hypothetical protein
MIRISSHNGSCISDFEFVPKRIALSTITHKRRELQRESSREEGFVVVPTGRFFLERLEFCDIAKSPEVFPPPLPSTRNSGGARRFHGGLVVVPTDFSSIQAAFGKLVLNPGEGQ